MSLLEYIQTVLCPCRTFFLNHPAWLRSRLIRRVSERVHSPFFNKSRHSDKIELIVTLGLPTKYDSTKWDSLLATMQRDKKSRAGQLRFVVLDDIEKPTIMTAPTNEMLFAAYQEICD